MTKELVNRLICEEIDTALSEVAKASTLDPKTRREVTGKLIKYGLDGNGRFPSLGSALAICNKVMREYGLNFMDIITADEISAEAASKTFLIGRGEQEISNSSLFFSWQKFGGIKTGQERKFEVVAYLG